MTGKVLRWERISRRMVCGNPDKLFVFGDNVARTGLGGQATEMRGELNAVGVPTKWRPATDVGAYFRNRDFERVKPLIDEAFERLAEGIYAGRAVVIPANGLGTGLAQLPDRAPKIFAYIEEQVACLSSVSET